jgi:hypothetical protein
MTELLPNEFQNFAAGERAEEKIWRAKNITANNMPAMLRWYLQKQESA